MRQKRSLRVRNKVFRKTDFMNLATILSKEQLDSQNAKHNSSLSFSVHCTDDTSYESESVDLLEDGGIVDIKQINSFDIYYRDYSVTRNVTLSLVPGKSEFSNICSVSGVDENWVEGVFTRLKEVLDNVTPQDNLLIRHPFFFLNCFALAIGYFLLRIVAIALEFFRGAPTTATTNPDNLTRFLEANPVIEWAILVAFIWIVGVLPADSICNWILSLWPSIEFDLGPEHLKLQKLRRRGLGAAITVFLAPFALAIGYDILKSLMPK